MNGDADGAEAHQFQAEVAELLNLMVHSVYSETDVFLRELISNASDALDKVRYEAIARPELLAGEEKLAIRLRPDAAARPATPHGCCRRTTVRSAEKKTIIPNGQWCIA